MGGFEIGDVERYQAGLEAVELLRQAGFIVENFDVDAEEQSSAFSLSAVLHVGEDERPLEALE